ncbi:MAG TPA: hypothetical protein VLV16_09190 [Gemmatimonadales bacterium]|nr:hypothetical protein [Gemmatimonadales bacterium]
MKQAVVLALLAAAPLAAQVPADAPGTTARTGPIFEAYSFGSGLAFDRVSELTIPVTASHDFGSRLRLDVAGAYATATVRASDGAESNVSGPTDIDVRATFAAVAGRLLLTFVGTLPTGTKALPDTTLPLFTILATDLFDFTTPSFGSGGGVTGGVATATRWGSWAVGGGASLRYCGSYEPVAGGGELKPGNEARARLGAEGPLGGGHYLRVALLYTLSQHDEVTGGAPSVSGDRVLFYSHLSMPMGRSSLSLYGFDMYRMRARKFNTTATSVVEVPRGNVLALGARVEHPLSVRATLAPSVELRHELTEQDSSLTPLGLIVRPGLDLRYRVSGPAALVFQAQVPFGYLKDQGSTISLVGPRLSAMLEWTR